MKKTTRIGKAVLGLGVWLGCSLLSRSAFAACPPCPDGLMDSYQTQVLDYNHQFRVDFPGGGSAAIEHPNPELGGYGPNDPKALVVVVQDAWCVGEVEYGGFSCHVENSVGDGQSDVQTVCSTTPAQNPYAIAYAMYCNVPVQ
jgi:hypothetical protein